MSSREQIERLIVPRPCQEWFPVVTVEIAPYCDPPNSTTESHSSTASLLPHDWRLLVEPARCLLPLPASAVAGATRL